jgi:hypothetical protein
MYTQFTDKGYLDNNSTIYGPVRLPLCQRSCRLISAG